MEITDRAHPSPSDLLARLEALRPQLAQAADSEKALRSVVKELEVIHIPLGMSMRQIEQTVIMTALAFTEWNKAETAKLLHLSRRTIYNLLAEWEKDLQVERCCRLCFVRDPERSDPWDSWPFPNLCASCAKDILVPRNGERAHGARLSHRGATAILRRGLVGGESVPDLADEYNVSITAVRALLARKTWRHLPDPRDPPPGAEQEIAALDATGEAA